MILTNIYRNPEFAKSVRGFAKSEFNTENIDFLLELNSQANVFGTKPLSENPATTPEALYEKYIKDDAINLINLPAVIRNNITKAYNEAQEAKKKGLDTPTFTIVDLMPAAREIEKMYSVDGFKRYQQSKQYENYLLTIGSSVAYESWKDERAGVIEAHIHKLEKLSNTFVKGVGEDNILGKENEENRKVSEKITAEIIAIRTTTPLPRDFSEDKLTFIEKARNWLADTAFGKFFGVQHTTKVEELKSDKSFNIRRMDSDLEDLEGDVKTRLGNYQAEKNEKAKANQPEEPKQKAADAPIHPPMTFSFAQQNHGHNSAPVHAPAPSSPVPVAPAPDPIPNPELKGLSEYVEATRVGFKDMANDVYKTLSNIGASMNATNKGYGINALQLTSFDIELHKTLTQVKNAFMIFGEDLKSKKDISQSLNGENGVIAASVKAYVALEKRANMDPPPPDIDAVQKAQEKIKSSVEGLLQLDGVKKLVGEKDFSALVQEASKPAVEIQSKVKNN